MTLFKCQMVYICANIFFLDEDPMQDPPPLNSALYILFWYFDEIQENHSSNKVATAKNTYC